MAWEQTDPEHPRKKRAGHLGVITAADARDKRKIWELLIAQLLLYGGGLMRVNQRCDVKAARGESGDRGYLAGNKDLNLIESATSNNSKNQDRSSSGRSGSSDSSATGQYAPEFKFRSLHVYSPPPTLVTQYINTQKIANCERV